MTGFAGRSEFFSREAGDYLRELGPLLSEGAPPPGDALLRLARALRGAAMLAGPPSYTRAARQFEQVARRVQEGSLPWGPVAPALREALADFQRLTGFAQAWDGGRDSEAEALELRLQALSGPAEPAGGRAPGAGEDGLRGFVARETTGLAAAVAKAAQVVASDPNQSRPAIAAARGAMQSLHGVAGLADLVPLGDILDTLDSLLADLDRHPSVPPGASRILELAATALARMAEDITHHGRPRDLTAAEQLADGVFTNFGLGDGTVPIEDLLLAGAERPLPGSAPRPAGAMDLASLGERLRFGAAQLRTAPTALAGAFRAYVLLAAIRAAPGGLGQEPAGAFLARLAASLERRDPLEDGTLAALIDQAGEHLAARMDQRTLSLTLAQLAARIPGDAAIVPVESLAPDAGAEAGEIVPIESLEPDEVVIVPIAELAPDEPEEVVPIEELAPDEPAAIVPIESLAPDEPEQVVPIEALAPDESAEVVPIEMLAPSNGHEAVPAPPPPSWPGLVVPADRTRLERTLSAYSRLVAANAPVLPLEALIPPAVPPILPTGSRSAAIEIEAELDVIPIESLLYRGPGALARADDVRRLLEGALKLASHELDRVEPLVRELLDLVPLAVTDAR